MSSNGWKSRETSTQKLGADQDRVSANPVSHLAISAQYRTYFPTLTLIFPEMRYAIDAVADSSASTHDCGLRILPNGLTASQKNSCCYYEFPYDATRHKPHL